MALVARELMEAGIGAEIGARAERDVSFARRLAT
jgi:hypothetical protein